MTGSAAQDPTRSAIAPVSSATVSSAPARASAIAATTSSHCSLVIPASPGSGSGGGSADSARVHSGRSAAGSRCTVPRGPRVLTHVRDRQRASRTSARVAPSIRSPADSSAAVMICAWAPHIRPTTSATAAPMSGLA